MEYISVPEAASKWGVRVRIVQQYCKQGRIDGARKYGNAWLIPAKAAKPARLSRAVKTPSPASPYMGCGLLNAVLAMPRKNADHVLSSLESTHQRLQYAAELAYLRGDFRPAAQRFFDVESGNETKICAARLGIMAAIACGDFGLYQKIEPFLEHCLHSESEQTRFYAQMTLAAPALNLFLPEAAPMPQLDHENHFDLSEEVRPMMMYLHAKSLQGQEKFTELLATCEAALLFWQKPYTFTLLDVYLLLFCAEACFRLGKTAEYDRWLCSALELALPQEIITPAAIFLPRLDARFLTTADRIDPAMAKRVVALSRTLAHNWRLFHQSYAKAHIMRILLPREYRAAQILTQGNSVAQAARELAQTQDEIRDMVRSACKKLSVTRPADLADYIH